MALRQVESEKKFVSAEKKQEVVAEIIGKSVEESQVIVAQAFGVKVKTQTKIRHQADGSVHMEMCPSKEQFEKFKLMRDLLSHSNPSGDWLETFEYLADKVILQKNKILQRKASQKTSEKDVVNENMSQKHSSAEVSQSAQGKQESRNAIPAAVLRELFQKQTYCQFVDKKSGRNCGSRWQLQTDHIKPVWAGGDNSLGNLQRLCAKHNRRRYQKQIGIRPC